MTLPGWGRKVLLLAIIPVPREINVYTLVSTLTRRGRHQRDRLVSLRKDKQCFSENHTREKKVRARDACMTGDTVRPTVNRLYILSKHENLNHCRS